MSRGRGKHEMPLPASVDTERFLLGAAMAGQGEIIDALLDDDFSLEKHRRILRAMRDLRSEGKHADCASVYNELERRGEKQSVDGLTYLISLDEHMPSLYNSEGWIEILREKSRLRAILLHLEDLKCRAFSGEKSKQLLASVDQIGQSLAKSNSEKEGPKTINDVVAKIGINEFLSPSKESGIDPPFAWLRRSGFRFAPKTLTTVSAATSVGKSAFVRACCLHAALHGHRTILYSLEVPVDEVFRACVGQVGSVNMQRFRMGEQEECDRKDAIATVDRLIDKGMLYVSDAGDITLADIRQELTRAENAGTPYEFVGLDYLQQIVPLGRFSNRVEEVSHLSRGVKMITQTYSIPIIQAAQLNRSADREQRPPRLSDLRESGSIEMDSNNVILMHRTAADPLSAQWTVRVNLAKQRNGSGQEQDMWFTRRYARFDEIEGMEMVTSGAGAA